MSATVRADRRLLRALAALSLRVVEAESRPEPTGVPAWLRAEPEPAGAEAMDVERALVAAG